MRFTAQRRSITISGFGEINCVIIEIRMDLVANSMPDRIVTIIGVKVVELDAVYLH